MKEIFISYSRKDTAIADQICAALDEQGISYFIDRKGIGGGAEFPDVLADGILECRIMLFLASENSYSSKFTKKEITFAFNEKPSGTIIPYIIDGSRLPKAMRLTFSDVNIRTLQEHPIETTLMQDICMLLGHEYVMPEVIRQRQGQAKPETEQSQQKLVVNKHQEKQAKRQGQLKWQSFGGSKSSIGRKLSFFVLAACTIMGIVMWSLSRRTETATSVETIDSISISRQRPDTLIFNSGSDTLLLTGDCQITTPLTGYGTITYLDGVRYQYTGRIAEGMRIDSAAVLTYKNGDRYEGSFVKDHFGTGVYVIGQDGSYFTGTFNNDLPYNGEWRASNGTRISIVVEGTEQ